MEGSTLGPITRKFLRLDRILISEDRESMFPLTTPRKIAREMSDHNVASKKMVRPQPFAVVY